MENLERDGGVYVSGLPLILQEQKNMKRRIVVLNICERERRENSKVKDIVLMQTRVRWERKLQETGRGRVNE